jgi:hypothetical protein
MEEMTEPPQPQYVHCRECHHEWVAFYAHAPVEEIVRFIKASCDCPACGAKNAALLGHYIPPDRRYSDYRHWLIRGEVGISSQTLLFAITGIRGRSDDYCIPADPDDFRRCYLLLQAFPELRRQLPKVAETFPAWAKLVAHWDQIQALLISEVGDIATAQGVAPKTYALMKELEK